MALLLRTAAGKDVLVGKDRTNRTIWKEVVRILARKFGWEAELVRADLAFYWQNALRVELQCGVAGACRDPKDEPILECAQRGNAGLIVTGDRFLMVAAR
jgi:predicted nucleic acid-binding protein